MMTDMSIFSSFNMIDIINLTTRITKYTGVQILDSMPWAELEMLKDVTDAMIKEENEETAKQEAKAKAQAAAARSRHMPSKPRMPHR
jgi:hypothetical protein